MQPPLRINHGIIFLVLTVLAIAILYTVHLQTTETYTSKVEIDVIPDDATVKLDGAETKERSFALTPGSYRFEASKDGFEPSVQFVEVPEPDTEIEVGLTPNPISKEANEWLEKNPEIQMQREALGGLNAGRSGAERERQTPLLVDLPYDQFGRYEGRIGPFSVDYGPTEDRQNGVFILISNSSPNGRKNALEWIQDQGTNPADIELVYDDFNNPLERN